MRSIFSVYLAANGSPDSRNTQLELPASPYRLLDALDELGIHDISEIDYWEVEQYHSFEYLMPHLSEDTSLADLNALAERLSRLDQVDTIAFEGLVKMAEAKPEPLGLKELYTFANCTYCCQVLCDVHSDAQLGRFYGDNGFLPELEDLPDNIYEKLDFGKLGREAREREQGVFTNCGYVVQTDELSKAYSTIKPSLVKPNYTMLIVLESEMTGQTVSLGLPATQKQIDLSLMEIDLDSLEGAKIIRYDGPIWDLNIDLCEMGGLEPLNTLAREIEAMDHNELVKFKAVLEATDCADVREAVLLADHLDDYTFDPALYSLESIGREGIRSIVSDKDAELLMKHINLYSYGKDFMESCGFNLTNYGVVIEAADPVLEQAEESGPQMSM